MLSPYDAKFFCPAGFVFKSPKPIKISPSPFYLFFRQALLGKEFLPFLLYSEG